MASQLSGDRPSAFESRNAISGLMPLVPASTRLSVEAATPSFTASARPEAQDALRRLRHAYGDTGAAEADVIVALGGDGHMLETLRQRLKDKKPVLPHHSYIEKAEYWAVVWGTIVMVITGVMLWLNNWTLQFLPKWVIDIATSVHWYEAVLASLAIVVWHFYSVMFDPDVYPLDTAWLTGKSPRRRESHEHGKSGKHDKASAPAHGD